MRKNILLNRITGLLVSCYMRYHMELLHFMKQSNDAICFNEVQLREQLSEEAKDLISGFITPYQNI